MLTNLQATTIDHFGMGMGSYDEARRTAAKLFDKVYGRGLRERLFVKINDKAHELRPLSHWPEAASRTVSTVVVPLNKIVGTESRSDDFDADFHPLKKHNRERWISVAAARRTGVVLPAVELVQDGNEYYVRDGHHRISVAKAMGQLEIDARIVN
jgi:hypothetical protein